MNVFDIYITYVSWGSGGKRRPVLILAENTEHVIVFKITTQFEGKSVSIREKYFAISEWRQAGLSKQSYIDTNNTITLPLVAVDNMNPIGKLSVMDERRLIEFLSRQ